ncbi:hypothetical protein ACLOJK_017260 [Asimina triloba]
MDLPRDLDEYIRESIQNTVGLPVPAKTLELKLLASEQSRHRLQDQIFLLQDRLKEKDGRIEQCRAEASMSARALRKQIEENGKLVSQCSYLVSLNGKWERQCMLYERDREALMKFGNEADERAKKAEIRARKAEEKLRSVADELSKNAEISAIEADENLRNLAEELKHYKHEYEMAMASETKGLEEMRVLRQRIDEIGKEKYVYKGPFAEM